MVIFGVLEVSSLDRWAHSSARLIRVYQRPALATHHHGGMRASRVGFA